MVVRRKRFAGKHAFTKEVLTTLAGAAVGVVANKALSDVFTAGGWNPSVIAPIVISDVAVLGAEIGGAFYAKKRGKYKASKFLISMAAGSAASDIYQIAGNANWWGVLAGAPAMRLGNGMSYGQGKYGRASPVGGKIGGYMQPINWAYPRR